MSFISAAGIAFAIFLVIAACTAVAATFGFLFDGDLALATLSATLFLILASMAIFVGSNLEAWIDVS